MTSWEREKLKDRAMLAQSAITLLSQLDRELIPQNRRKYATALRLQSKPLRAL